MVSMHAAAIRQALPDHAALEQIRVERNQLAIGDQRKPLAEAVCVLCERCLRVLARRFSVAHCPSIPLCDCAVAAIVNGLGSSDVQDIMEIDKFQRMAFPALDSSPTL